MGTEAATATGTLRVPAGAGAEPPPRSVSLSRRQKRLQLLRIRQKEAKRRQSPAPPEGTYRRKPAPVKRYAGDVLAPVSAHPPGGGRGVAGAPTPPTPDTPMLLRPPPIPPQSYIRSLRDRQLESATPPGPAGPPDDDCGSTVPLTAPPPRGPP